MPHLTLTRDLVCPDGVFGILDGAGLPAPLQTAEDDWKDNEAGQSCIPVGTYALARTVYHKHGFETFEVTGVPGRSLILIHPGNTEENTMGCILVGTARGVVQVTQDEDTGQLKAKKQGVLHSQVAFAQFMEAMRGVDAATLTVQWAAGLP